MPDSPVARRISPMLAAADRVKHSPSIRKFWDSPPILKSPEYAVMERDGQTIHFQKAASEEVLKCVRGPAEIYIEVTGIRPFWEHERTFKNQCRIRDLFDREYGMTEFRISDSNECLVFVGEPISN